MPGENRFRGGGIAGRSCMIVRAAGKLGGTMTTKVAVIQKPPVLLDRDKTIARVLESIDEAAGAGASLLVFPEAYVPGYPTWNALTCLCW